MKKNPFSCLFPFCRPPVESASFSARGLVRRENQDRLMVRRARPTFCVADGMGGGEGGAEASRIVCSELSATVARHRNFGPRVRACADAVRTANARIRAFAERAGYRQMATTVALLALDAEDPSIGVVGHVGDSRVYRFRDGGLTCLTHDHTMAGELSRTAVTRAMADEIGCRRHPLAHVLTRAVGVGREVHPEWRKIDVRPGDRYLVCSDGVYDMVPDDALRAAFAAGGAPREVVRRVSREVVAAGAHDNYSLVVVDIRAVAR